MLCKGFIWVHPLNHHRNSEVDIICIPILRMQKLRHKKVSYLVQGYTATKLEMNWNLGNLIAAYKGTDGRSTLELQPPKFQSYLLPPKSVIVDKAI